MEQQKTRMKAVLIAFMIAISFISYGQVTVISGVLTEEESREPVIGATITIKGTTKGTVTDIDGKYSFNASPDDVLVYSFIGMKPQEVTVGNQTVINVEMPMDFLNMEEVVVVGYGVQKKVNLTGSVSNIETKALQSRSITDLTSGLAGLAPGVQVTQGSGGEAGGSGASIRIRGIGTLNNSNPLVIVDGIQTSMGDIDPNDVASISVLKDAASASIYGSRGANGVILVTTKRGKSGDAKVSYNFYAGVQEATMLPKFVNNFATYMEMTNQYRGAGQEIFQESDIIEWKLSSNPLTHPNEDWYANQVGERRFMQSHNLAVSGGSNKTTYRFSLNYLDHQGLVVGNELQRYGLRTNVESQVSKRIQIGANMFYRWTELSPTVNFNTGLAPAMPAIQSPDGRWGGPQIDALGTLRNPFAFIENNKDDRREQRLLSNVFLKVEPIKGLTFKGSFAINYDTEFRKEFQSLFSTWNFRTESIYQSYPDDGLRKADVSHSHNYLLTGTATVNYQKELGSHNINILGGYEVLDYQSENISAGISQFVNDEVQELNAGLLDQRVGGSQSEWGLISYFGRVNYNFKNKYLFEANIRTDGSSRFKDGNKWGVFPSFSVGWNMESEEFMKNLSFIDLLKVRASWGQLGNNQIGNYSYQSVYSLNQNYSFNGEVYSGIAQNALVDQNITWETTTTSDIGFDLSIKEGKFNFAFDYFTRETADILTKLPIPDFLGAKSEPDVNLATMLNKGFETSAMYRDRQGDFKYSVGVNLTMVNNEVTKYNSDIATGNIQEGHPYNVYFGYEHEGIFQSQEEIDGAPEHAVYTSPGDIRYKDQLTVDTDGDGVFDAADGMINSADRVVIGNRIPKFTYGGNINLSYKGFDLGVVLQGIANRDQDINSSNGIKPVRQGDRGFIHEIWLDAWSEENKGAVWPRLDRQAMDGMNMNVESTFWIRDVSFLRVKNVQFGYNFPTALLDKIGVSRLRTYISSDNLLTFSNNDLGFDPEVFNPDNVPNVRTYVVGLNLTF